MRRRPMQGLLAALRGLGADIRCAAQEGFLPLEIRARGLRGGVVTIDASESSQMLSALLMVAPLAAQTLEIGLAGGVRWPFVQMTARLMEEFGQPPLERRGTDRLPPQSPPPTAGPPPVMRWNRTRRRRAIFLPCRWSPAAGWRCRGMRRSVAGRRRICRVLEQAGLSRGSNAPACGWFRPGAARRGVAQDFREFSDTFLTLAAIAPLLEGPTRITGIAHTRRQETDRVAGTARELGKLGQQVVEEPDALTITPRPLTVRRGNRDHERPPVRHELRHPGLPRPARRRPSLARGPIPAVAPKPSRISLRFLDKSGRTHRATNEDTAFHHRGDRRRCSRPENPRRRTRSASVLTAACRHRLVLPCGHCRTAPPRRESCRSAGRARPRLPECGSAHA